MLDQFLRLNKIETEHYVYIKRILGVDTRINPK